MTFSEYIIQQRSRTYYITSLSDIIKCNSTLEEWFKDLYYEYKLLY